MQHGNTPLHDTAWYGYSRTVQFLVQCGANVQQLNKVKLATKTTVFQQLYASEAQFCRLSPVDAHTVALKVETCHGNITTNYTLFTILYCGILLHAQV